MRTPNRVADTGRIDALTAGTATNMAAAVQYPFEVTASQGRSIAGDGIRKWRGPDRFSSASGHS